MTLLPTVLFLFQQMYVHSNQETCSVYVVSITATAISSLILTSVHNTVNAIA